MAKTDSIKEAMDDNRDMRVMISLFSIIDPSDICCYQTFSSVYTNAPFLATAIAVDYLPTDELAYYQTNPGIMLNR
jgi:hypothetical protein